MEGLNKMFLSILYFDFMRHHMMVYGPRVSTSGSTCIFNVEIQACKMPKIIMAIETSIFCNIVENLRCLMAPSDLKV